MIIYRKYHIVKGLGQNQYSSINAFDLALNEANISEANLVPVSSILAKNSKEVLSSPVIEIGEIVHCVLARQDGVEGEKIGAGIACVIGRSGADHYGLVMEMHGNYKDEELINGLEDRVGEMVRLRNFIITEKKIVVASINKIESKYGSVIVSVIFR